MKRFGGRFEGDQVITGDAVFDGIIAGDLIVPSGYRLELEGTVTGDLLVEEGGSAIVRGTVQGTVLNNGGAVEVYGEVGNVAGTHRSHVDPNAVVLP